MILMSGGTDGGTVTHLVEMAEMLRLRRPQAAPGHRPETAGHLRRQRRGACKPSRRSAGRHRGPARGAQPAPDAGAREPRARPRGHPRTVPGTRHAAGARLRQADRPGPAPASCPRPTPSARSWRPSPRERGINVLGVDIGGATTDVFSVFGGIFNRTVSANLGMSYSICNVLTEAGVRQHRAAGCRSTVRRRRPAQPAAQQDDPPDDHPADA